MTLTWRINLHITHNHAVNVLYVQVLLNFDVYINTNQNPPTLKNTKNVFSRSNFYFPGLTHDSYTFINAAIISVLASAAASSFGNFMFFVS